MGFEALATGGLATQDHMPAALLARFLVRALARRREEGLFHQRPCRLHGDAKAEGAQAGAERRGAGAAGQARAGHQRLVVGELVAPGAAAQRVAAVHDAGVDGRHNEGRDGGA